MAIVDPMAIDDPRAIEDPMAKDPMIIEGHRVIEVLKAIEEHRAIEVVERHTACAVVLKCPLSISSGWSVFLFDMVNFAIPLSNSHGGSSCTKSSVIGHATHRFNISLLQLCSIWGVIILVAGGGGGGGV